MHFDADQGFMGLPRVFKLKECGKRSFRSLHQKTLIKVFILGISAFFEIKKTVFQKLRLEDFSKCISTRIKALAFLWMKNDDALRLGSLGFPLPFK